MQESIIDLRIEEIERRVQLAISQMSLNEWDLFVPLGNERNISQRFALWLERQFPNWNVDCEYNQIIDGTSKTARRKVADLYIKRYKGSFKQLDEPEETLVIPDIIIHCRQTDQNLLAIEVKISNDSMGIRFDHEKLRAYREYEPLNYRYSLFIRFQEPSENNQIVAEQSFC